MESYTLTKENLQSMIEKIRELTKDRKYWIGIATSRIKSIEDHDWFRGIGTFEKVVQLSISDVGYGIKIKHLSVANHPVVVNPSFYDFLFGEEIIFNNNDIIISFPKHIQSTGTTFLYMEWTVSRNEKYSH